ncbi:MAG: haloacid dehalogenase type II [Caenispirillum bisanense]|nr:haloacid dehalogenase type II [Caenispirillum bisanense]MCA1973253.1 haloacid dehalogenase type II [Caenispirillum sp.]
MPAPSMPIPAGACVFDAYGTLFDVAAAARHLQDRLGDQWAPLAALWRQKQLEYTWLRSLMGRYADFWQVTGEALRFTLDTLKLEDEALYAALMDLYLRLDAYPEVPGMLKALQAKGIRTAILTNGSPAMVQAAVRNARLEDLLEVALSVDELAVYKPDPRVYRLACDRLDLPAEKIVFLSSNAWDVAGAASFGFRVVWINRFGQAPERLPAGPEAVLTTLAPLPDLVTAAS